LIFVPSEPDLKSILNKALTLSPEFIMAFLKNLRELELPYRGFGLAHNDISLTNTKGKTIKIGSLPAGEKLLLFFAALITIREVMVIQDPLILDCPFAKLDNDKFEKIHTFLKKKKNQIIIFTTEKRLKADVTLG
jgi:hypothetical protein